MANCTISTMEVNDCHLQFFDSLGNLIYEFDLKTIIALNNGNGILIKDDLTTLTIDNNIVVDNLTMTIAELITYIQEQRVLCDCECNAIPTGEVAAVTWGYDAFGTLFYVKPMSDGTQVYESPIGNPLAPTGNVINKNPFPATINTVFIETAALGSVPSCVRWSVVNKGGASALLNGINFDIQNVPITGEYYKDNITGITWLASGFTYDASASTIFIKYEFI